MHQSRSLLACGYADRSPGSASRTADPVRWYSVHTAPRSLADHTVHVMLSLGSTAYPRITVPLPVCPTGLSGSSEDVAADHPGGLASCSRP